MKMKINIKLFVRSKKQNKYSNFETENMDGYTVKFRTCNLKTTLCPLFMNVVQPPQGQSHLDETVRYILGIFIIVFQNLPAKTEYAKHVVRNITFSEAAGQDNNITGQTACEQVLYMGIHGIWEVGGRGYTL